MTVTCDDDVIAHCAAIHQLLHEVLLLPAALRTVCFSATMSALRPVRPSVRPTDHVIVLPSYPRSDEPFVVPSVSRPVAV